MVPVVVVVDVAVVTVPSGAVVVVVVVVIVVTVPSDMVVVVTSVVVATIVPRASGCRRRGGRGQVSVPVVDRPAAARI
jgi:hypothetical protein